MAIPLTLFSRRIERIHELTEGPPVPVESSSEATYCIDPLGRQWVRKKAELTGFNELIAESIGSLLAESLKLPVPRGAVADIGPEPAWLSERVRTSFTGAKVAGILLPTATGSVAFSLSMQFS